MSAIWALLRHAGAPVETPHLEQMGAALQSLGPERVDLWREGMAGLGHRRMVFTPEDRSEQQPIVSNDGRLVLVYDGRLDNRPELAEALQLRPAAARLWPDSAYVLRAFQTWGEDTPQYLVGGLAFIVWDKQRRRLLAAVSPGSNRALYYHQTPQALALANLPPGLLALPWVPRRLNEARLASFLGGGRGEDRTATFFDGLQRLPGGHLLTAAEGAVNLRAFWNPDPTQELRLPRDEDYVEAFNELFERVVSDHLRSTTPVAVMMSGGLDSTSVAAVAAPLLKAQGHSLLSLTSIPDPQAGDSAVRAGRFADESPYVKAVAALYDNLTPEFVSTDGQWFLDGLEAYFEHHLAPPRAEPNRVWLDAVLQTASARGCGVILTGESGNHTFSWDGAGLVAYYLRQGRLPAAWREARANARRSRSFSFWRTLFAQGLLPLLPEPAAQLLDQLRARTPTLLPSPLNPGYAEAHGLKLRRVRVTSSPRARLNARRARFTGDGHVSGWRSQFGVDARDPTSDQRIVEFCLSLPHDQFQRNGQARWLVRRAMAGRLPPEVLNNSQRGLQSADWLYRLRGRHAEVQSTLLALRQHELARTMLDLDRLDRLTAAWPEPKSNPLVQYEYRVLQQGLVAGRFIIWAQP